MSLLDVDSIDYVGVNILFRQVSVGIFDDLDWDDEATHFALLTKKIDRYTQYIRSGQLLAGYPGVRGYSVVIEYVATRPMTQSAKRFWKTREHIIRNSGYEVRSRIVDVRPVLRGEKLRGNPMSPVADDTHDDALPETHDEVEFGTVSHLAPLLPLPSPGVPEVPEPAAMGSALVVLPRLAPLRR